MCKYCEGELDIEEIDKEHPLNIIYEYNKKYLYLDDYKKDYQASWEINYCPMCGIKLQ